MFVRVVRAFITFYIQRFGFKGIPRSKYKLISYERASKNMKNAFYFMQKSWTILKILQFLVFKENWIRIIYAKVMTSHLSNPYIVTHKNVNNCWSIASLDTKLCRVINHHNQHLLKEKFILVRPPITSSRPLQASQWILSHTCDL